MLFHAGSPNTSFDAGTLPNWEVRGWPDPTPGTLRTLTYLWSWGGDGPGLGTEPYGVVSNGSPPTYQGICTFSNNNNSQREGTALWFPNLNFESRY
jgi:hypothetical protein